MKLGGGGGSDGSLSTAAAALLLLLLPPPAAQDGGGVGPDDNDNAETGGGGGARLRKPASSPCEFPPRWRGEYFQGSLREPFHVTTQNFGPEGLCYRAHADGTYIIFNRGEKCYKCLRVAERHANVLEYQLGTCRRYESPGEEFCTIPAEAPFRYVHVHVHAYSSKLTPRQVKKNH
jgi:hypothetical protein